MISTTTLVAVLGAILLLWMLACGWCGYRRRLLWFLLVLLAGLGLNMSWMVFGLGGHPFEPHALMAHAAAILYASGSFVVGFLISRVVRQFRATSVRDLPPQEKTDI
jgi:hypothetical protein